MQYILRFHAARLCFFSDIYKEVISEENMRFVRRKVRMVFWAIMFVETARRKSRLGTERRKKVLEDGMSAIFSQFKNSPILNKANDLCKVMSKESGDMTVGVYRAH